MSSENEQNGFGSCCVLDLLVLLLFLVLSCSNALSLSCSLLSLAGSGGWWLAAG